MLSASKYALAFASLLHVCILFACLSPANAQFRVWQSKFISAVTGHAPPAAAPKQINHHLLENDVEHPTENAFPFHGQLHPGSEEKGDTPNQPPDTASESLLEETLGEDTYVSSSSSEEISAALASAFETVRDIQHKLNPSDLVDDENKVTAKDLISTDAALQHLRHVISILSSAHDALLDGKVAELPLIQRLWFKIVYAYRYSPIIRNQLSRKDQLHSKLSDPGNGIANEEAVRTVTATLTKEMAQSLSTLKEFARNAAHGGWRVAPDVNAYASELTRRVNVLTDKWRHKMEIIVEAARPIGTGISSNERVNEVLGSVEEMVSEFQDEIWRMRTEWFYKRSETLSWASANFQEVKQMGKHGLDRLSVGAYDRLNSAKYVLMEGLDRNKVQMGYLQKHASDRMNDFIGLTMLFINVSKGLLRSLMTILKNHLMKFWRIFAFITVIAFFRLLLNFMHVNFSVPSFVSSAFLRNVASPSSHRNSGSGSRRVSETAPIESTTQSGSQTKSESSDSRPTKKEASREKAPRVMSRPSRIQETASTRKVTADDATTKLHRRKAPQRPGKVRNVSTAKPLRVSNSDYQTASPGLQQQSEGKPLCIGDHEVQLVYDESPESSLPNSANNESNSVLRRLGTTTVPGSTRVQDTARNQHSRRVSERVIVIHNDDNSGEATGSLQLGDPKQTRSSARRNSTRRSRLR